MNVASPLLLVIAARGTEQLLMWELGNPSAGGPATIVKRALQNLGADDSTWAVYVRMGGLEDWECECDRENGCL
jgi:hypothetical protein